MKVGRSTPSDLVLRRFGGALSGLSIAAGPVALVMFGLAGQLDDLVQNFSLLNASMAVSFGLLGLLLIRSQPRSLLVWVLVATAVFSAVAVLIHGAWHLVARRQGVDNLNLIDTEGWPTVVVVLAALGYPLWVFANYSVLTLGLLLVPDGRLPSPRWRPVAALSILSMATMWMALVTNWPVRDGDIGDPAAQRTAFGEAVLNIAYITLFSMVVLSFVSLLVRYRGADGPTRRRLRWVLAGGAVIVALVPAAIAGGNLVLLVFHPMLGVSLALAIWRDQLFDIDSIISRSLVYASTLAVIAAVYVVIVFGIGSLVDQAAADSPVLPVLATVLVAVIVHPARTRLERLANRLVFGRRATPYEVLSDFTQRVAATDATLLDDVAHNVTGGTAATAASVWSLQGGILHPVSVWPSGGHVGPTPAISDTDTGGLLAPSATHTYPIDHDGRTIGLLGLTLPSGEELASADQALIADLLNGIGLALWNRRLTVRLRKSIDDLQASRRRLVAMQDDVRHKLERDLHDGAQQRLVAIKVRLSIAQQISEKHGADATATVLAELCGHADETIESLRDFARGVYPPLLEAEGIAAAVEAHLSRVAMPVRFSAEVDRRHDRDIEATVYFSVLEILAALERGPSQQSVAIEITEGDVHLQMTIEVKSEAGVIGSCASDPPSHVVDRVEAIAGTIERRADESDGAVVTVIRLPIDPIGSHPVAASDGDRLVSA